MSQTRQLAAIMFTDIVGYSALMGKDEEGAMQLLDLNRQMQQELVAAYEGKWIKELGDGVIIVFDSVLNAVKCAIDIQAQARATKNLALKIAIHSGEIIMTADDVFGDSVNLTARIEQLAQEDSIIISESALSAIRNVTSIQTSLLGKFTLKNIQLPVSLHAVLGNGLRIPILDQEENSIGATQQDASEIDASNDPLVGRAKVMIEENLANSQLSVAYLCQELGVSRPQLYRKVLAETGFSPSDFIRELRLREAAVLLKSAEHNVSEVAYQTGFNNLSYFSKCFQERFGRPPSDYRKKQNRNVGAPNKLDTFIGREQEIQEIIKILDRSRLLTLTGPGGTGKTRLASKVMESHGKTFRDGAYFVQLAPINAPDGVVPKIAQILQIQQNATKENVTSIIEFIGDQEVLLLLDNFEHVLEAAVKVNELIISCPRVKVLVTSRVVLNLVGEAEYTVPQLLAPEVGREYSLEELLEFPSVSLLVDRAQNVNPNFELTRENSAAVSEICIQLDGLPLALELAAARFKLFSPEALLRRLGNKLDILSSTSSNQPDRHKTLRNAIDWSYNLLTPEEQTLFRRLSVFSGGCTLEAAEKICFQGYKANLNFIDQIAGLADKSLIQREDQKDGEPRFYMLETLKAFGQERLAKSLEKKDTSRQFIDYMVTMVESAQKHLTGANQAMWLEKLEPELDNIRAVLAWAEEHEEAETGLKVAISFWRFWNYRSMMREGSSWMDRMLSIYRANNKSLIRCRALNISGTLNVYTGDLTEAATKFALALSMAEELNDKKERGNALTNLSWVLGFYPEIDQCREYAGIALEIHNELQDIRGKVRVYNNLSAVEQLAGNIQKTLEINQRSVDLSREMGDQRSYAYTSARQAWYGIYAGKFDEATKILDQAIELMTALYDDHVMAFALNIKALNRYYQGDLEQAIKFLKRAQPYWDNEGNPYGKAQWNLIHILIHLKEDKIQKAAELMDLVVTDPAIRMYGFNAFLYSLVRAQIMVASGQDEEALKHLKSSLNEAFGKKVFLFFSRQLELMSHLLAKRQEYEKSLLLFSQAARMRKENQIPVPPVNQSFYN
ncbi:MAG: helix-turn-helix domain-containing protein, partial [Saprospiraceae bacterium]|nr:helix-turn-helix domain-containing protein [Saprospiraceae bacterium]